MILTIDFRKDGFRRRIGVVRDAEYVKRRQEMVGTDFHSARFKRGSVAVFKGDHYHIYEIFFRTHDTIDLCLC